MLRDSLARRVAASAMAGAASLAVAAPPPGADVVPLGSLPGSSPAAPRSFSATAAADTAGPTIDVWYGDVQRFGRPGQAQRWVNVLGRVSDPSGVNRLEYSLNGAAFVALRVGPELTRLYMTGDFDVEIDPPRLRAGSNTLRLRGTDGVGNVSERTVLLDWPARAIWPLPYAIDWDAVAAIQDAVQVVDGRWVRVPGGVRIADPAYDRLLAIGDLEWRDYEITFPFAIHGLDPSGFSPTSGAPGFGMILRWTGHTDNPIVCPPPHCGWIPHGSSLWYSWDYSGGVPGDIGGSIVDLDGERLAFDVTYVLKVRVETVPGAGSLYKYRLWRAGETEPVGWNASGLGDPTVPAGSALIIAHHAEATIGDVTVLPLPDTTRPTPPTGLDATATSAFGVRLAWTAATDDFQVVEYRVYRNGVAVGTSATTSFIDQPLPADTQQRYTVAARDEGGNESLPSAEVSIQTPRAPVGPPCGDGTVDPGEQCDDANLSAGDGCTSICTIEAPPNVLANGGFSGSLSPWFFFSNGSAQATLLDGRARVAVGVPGTNVQLSQAGVAVRGNTRYRLSFRARSLDGADVQVGLFQNGPPYSSYGLTRSFDLTPLEQTFTTDFVTTPGNKTDARFSFALGPYDRAGSDYRFDDVVLQEFAGGCGDGSVDSGETCDDGDLDNADACLNDCRPATCGDGWTRAGVEACDDGNVVSGDGCSATCTSERNCGDGVLDPGETCDDGNTVSGDGCRGNCTRELCGDGTLDPPETCDDGNVVPGDGCSATCTNEPYCGDGTTGPGEQCDTRGDSASCDADCTAAVCGDGRRNAAAAEACDDGNTAAGDGCSPTCTVEAASANVVRNGSFTEGKAGWQFYTNGSGAFDVVSGEARVAIQGAGTNVQLFQSGLALAGNTQYRLRLRARNTGGDDVAVVLQQHGAPYAAYGLNAVLDLAAEFREHVVTFRTTAGDKHDARLMLWLAPYDRAGQTYAFDDVSIERVLAGAECGNGVVEAGETCDAGTQTAACDADCTAVACGDGRLNAAAGEICDDGNVASGDGCSATCATEIPTVEIVRNGSFAAGAAPWQFYSSGGASFTVVGGEARIVIQTEGTNVQLYQIDVALAGDTRYRLRFRGRNTGGDDVQVALRKHAAPYTSYGLERVFDLTAVDQSFSFEFRTTPGDKSDARLMFWLAPYDRAGQAYFFDDVVLERLGP